MGRGSRERPGRLGEKLTQIRSALGLSQNEMLSRLRLTDKLNRDDLSKYERGVREPSVIVMLRYARAAGVCLDVLADDDLDLPAKLPAKPNHSR
ncbi:MAG TPA: helix-turn-helix domain-containing protein [Pyrinomonadaceae bacterium]